MFNLSNIRKRNDKIVLQYFEDANSSKEYSYADLYIHSIELSTNLENFLIKTVGNSKESPSKCNIAILLSVHSPALLPAIVGIENAGCVSGFLDYNEDFDIIRQRLVNFQTNIILCDFHHFTKINTDNEQLTQILRISLFDIDCVVAQVKDLKCKFNATSNIYDDKIKSSRCCFFASTSGSCGEVKPIGVTYKCFWPNIISLGKLYDVTELDVIFVSSPPTFDPFMIDICLALHHEASLVMTDHKLRCDSQKLLDVLFPAEKPSKVTIMQITPSLFMRWTSNDIKYRVFSNHSKLRILALGGEPFPSTSEICKWMNWEHWIRMFNLYGLTEMSCWAAIYEIVRNDISIARKIPIGQPIDEYTSFDVSADGELLLKSKIRKCFQPQLTDAQVTDNKFEFILHTGDLVHLENEEFFFSSRKNSIIKFYGQKVNLSDIENCAKNVENVEDLMCLHHEQQNSIILFVKCNEHLDDVKMGILTALRNIRVNVKIICVSQFPLTAHGKVCRSDLLNLIPLNDSDEPLQSMQLMFEQLINESLGIEITNLNAFESVESQKRIKTNCDSSFIHLGGSSLKAIQIVDEIERITSQSISYLLPMLLDERISIREILSRFWSDKGKFEEVIKKSTGTDSDQVISEVIPRWRIDMSKCIDATPTICTLKSGEVVVSVGSHSKLLYNIFVNGQILSKLELPDRIESQVVQKDDCGIVGCYDGYLYCFDIRTAEVKWTFNSGAMIKCRAHLINSFVIFGNYNETNNVWCLNAKDGSLVWSAKIGTKSIYANPVKMNDKHCLICSLDGTVTLINCFNVEMLWTFDAKAPIFSTPTVYQADSNEEQIIVAAVNGTIYNLNSEGVSTWSHQVDGNIFSSIEHFSSSSNKNCINLIFGSQNHNIYCFEIDGANVTESWRVKSTASIRSNAIFMDREHSLWAAIFSSDGLVKVINCDNGQIILQRKINGEVFSTPAIHNGALFVGSRNNFLYCIDLNEINESI